MTPEQTYLLVGAVIGLIGAVQAWVVSKTVQHEGKLNGTMDARIAQGAKSVIANDHALRGETPSPAANVATLARIAALRAELDGLESSPDPLANAVNVTPGAKR